MQALARCRRTRPNRHASCLTPDPGGVVRLKKPSVSGLWAALAFVVLFFGPAISQAQTRGFGPRGACGGSFGLRPGHVGVVAGHRAFLPRRNVFIGSRFSRPFVGFRPFHRPFRFVRVRVLFPYPHWVVRRVAWGFAGSDCAPY